MNLERRHQRRFNRVEGKTESDKTMPTLKARLEEAAGVWQVLEAEMVSKSSDKT